MGEGDKKAGTGFVTILHILQVCTWARGVGLRGGGGGGGCLQECVSILWGSVFPCEKQGQVWYFARYPQVSASVEGLKDITGWL
jgi:hypothetical protein